MLLTVGTLKYFQRSLMHQQSPVQIIGILKRGAKIVERIANVYVVGGIYLLLNFEYFLKHVNTSRIISLVFRNEC